MKKLLAIMLVLVLALSFAACGADKAGNTDSDLAYITNNGKMVIGYTVYAPMNYTDDNGEFVGEKGWGKFVKRSLK